MKGWRRRTSKRTNEKNEDDETILFFLFLTRDMLSSLCFWTRRARTQTHQARRGGHEGRDEGGEKQRGSHFVVCWGQFLN